MSSGHSSSLNGWISIWRALCILFLSSWLLVIQAFRSFLCNVKCKGLSFFKFRKPCSNCVVVWKIKAQDSRAFSLTVVSIISWPNFITIVSIILFRHMAFHHPSRGVLGIFFRTSYATEYAMLLEVKQAIKKGATGTFGGCKINCFSYYFLSLEGTFDVFFRHVWRNTSPVTVQLNQVGLIYMRKCLV